VLPANGNVNDDKSWIMITHVNLYFEVITFCLLFPKVTDMWAIQSC